MGEAKASEGGRLIYCGRDEWVHSNCALWSSEVYEEIDGSLQNVQSAISRGRQMRCSMCDKKGASVGCCFKACGVTYHFACARRARCSFFQNKTVYCRVHDTCSITVPLLTNEKDFEILRPVYIENDRKKKKYEWHANVKLRIGSLHVESLGRIDPHLSDKPALIIPIYFRCTRLFWSTTKPWKLIQYHIQIKVSYSRQKGAPESDVNYTIDHSSRDEIVHGVVKRLIRQVEESWQPAKGDRGERGCAVYGRNRGGGGISGRTFREDGDNLGKDAEEGEKWSAGDVPRKPQADRNRAAVFEKLCSSRKNCAEETNSTAGRPQSGTEPTRTNSASKTKTLINGGVDSANNRLRDKNEEASPDASLRKNCAGIENVNTTRGKVLKFKRKVDFEKSVVLTKKKLFVDDYVADSKLGNVLQYYSTFKNIMQVDGMVDVHNDEEPVKCIQCHRTYRTALSFQRHLQTCNAEFADYMISSCESDSASSEEEKIAYSNADTVAGTMPDGVQHYEAAYLVENEKSGTPPCINNVCFSVNYNEQNVYPAYGNSTSVASMSNSAAIATPPTLPTVSNENVHLIDGLNETILHNFKCGANRVTMASPMVVPPDMNGKYISIGGKSCMGTDAPFALSDACNIQTTCDVQNMTTPAAFVIHSFPKTQLLPTYIALGDGTMVADCNVRIADPYLQAPLHLQQVTNTLSQPAPIHFQPIIPNIAFVQQNATVEPPPAYVVNTAPASSVMAPAVVTDLFSSSQDGIILSNQSSLLGLDTIVGGTIGPPVMAPTVMTDLFSSPQEGIILSNQPPLLGLETIVSNTIMASSQYMAQSLASGVGASAMYSTTTTQVFQAASKPLPQQEFPQSFIVLNTGAPTSEAIQATVQSKPFQQTPSYTSTNFEKCMYIQVNPAQQPPQSISAKRPLIVKPAKRNVAMANKPAAKVMKVKNNRPIAIQTTADEARISSSSSVKGAASSLQRIRDSGPQIEITDQSLRIQQPDSTKTAPSSITVPVLNTQSSSPATSEPSKASTAGALACTNNEKLVKKLPEMPGNAVRNEYNVVITGASADNSNLAEKVSSTESLNNVNGSGGDISAKTSASSSSSSSSTQTLKPSFLSSASQAGTTASVNSKQSIQTSRLNGSFSKMSSTFEQKGCTTTPSAVVHNPPAPSSKPGEARASQTLHPKLCTASIAGKPAAVAEEKESQSFRSKPYGSLKVSQPVVTVESEEPLFFQSKLNSSTDADKPVKKYLVSEVPQTTYQRAEREDMSKATLPLCQRINQRTEMEEKFKVTTPPSPSPPPVITFAERKNDCPSKESKSASDELFDRLFLLPDRNVKEVKNCEKTAESVFSSADAPSSSAPLPTSPPLEETTVSQDQRSSEDEKTNTNQDVPPDEPPITEDKKPTSETESTLPRSKIEAVPGVQKSSSSSEVKTEESNADARGAAEKTWQKSKYKPNFQRYKLLWEKKPVGKVETTNSSKKTKSPEKENNGGQVKGEVTLQNGSNGNNWKTASISYEVNAEDGFSYKTNSLLDLWNKILESVQQSRAKYKLPLLPKNASMNAESVYSLLGFENNASKYLLEQLPDAWKCIFYKPVFHKPSFQNGKTALVESESGCARADPFTSKHKFDMFGWLASRHRKPPKFMMVSDSDIVNGNRYVVES